jgi:hypothetical protein
MMRRTILAVVVGLVPPGLPSAVTRRRVALATGARIPVPDRVLADVQPGGSGR